MNSICVWYNPKSKQYYHKIVRGFAFNYEIGQVNSYGHILIYIIKIEKMYKPYKNKLRDKLIKLLIYELRKLY